VELPVADHATNNRSRVHAYAEPQLTSRTFRAVFQPLKDLKRKVCQRMCMVLNGCAMEQANAGVAPKLRDRESHE